MHLFINLSNFKMPGCTHSRASQARGHYTFSLSPHTDTVREPIYKTAWGSIPWFDMGCYQNDPVLEIDNKMKIENRRVSSGECVFRSVTWFF